MDVAEWFKGRMIVEIRMRGDKIEPPVVHVRGLLPLKDKIGGYLQNLVSVLTVMFRCSN